MRSVGSSVRRLLLVLAVVILAVYAIVAAINRPVGGDVITYHAEFSDVFGLHKNADVRVRGVQVGKVLDIELEPSGVARVEFTVRTENRLTDRDTLAIRFQNLVGQRYLAITEPGTATGTGTDTVTLAAQQGTGEAVDPERTIPANKTSGSFDITALFNGMRPILQGADPAVFNTFATNMLHLLQGENGVGVGDVLADVDKLTAFASDKSALITVIVTNLGVISKQLQGKSAIINSLLDGLGMLFDTLEQRIDMLKSAFGDGARVFPPIVEIMNHTFDLGLGGHDHLSDRIMELVPETYTLADVLSLLPTMLSTVNATMDNLGFDAKCTHGQVDLPEMGTVLLGGGKVTLCKS